MIAPLELETWFVNVFSGNASYFSILALLSIVSICAYFKMNGVAMGFTVAIFLLMFSGYVPLSLTILLTIIGGLVIAYWISRIVKLSIFINKQKQ